MTVFRRWLAHRGNICTYTALALDSIDVNKLGSIIRSTNQKIEVSIIGKFIIFHKDFFNDIYQTVISVMNI